MARKIITCKACKARFDVARYPPGSRVRCGRCSQVLTVPVDQPTGGAKAAPGTGAAAPPRPAAGMAPAPKAGIGGAASKRVATAAGGTRTPDRDPLLGETLYDQYEIIRKLGEGGYGAVYEAHDVTLERRMAIKVMLRSRAQNREYVAKFLREARTAAQLAHPNVVGVHGVGFDKKHGLHFLSMEYVEGRTIHDILQERGPLPVDDALEYIVQACRGLGAAHDRNIIHRDIKPGNLMVTGAGIVKIADFGLAKVYDPDGAQSTVIGTPYFMPPEQFEGKAKDGRTDIYALGVTFYYMLTMKRPHTGNGPAQILLSVMSQEPKSVCDHRPELPEGLWPIVRRMIHRDLDTRYGRCPEIIRDLEALRGGVEVDEEPVYCPGCGVPNPMESEQCTKCGESLLETCPACGAEDLAGTRFCGDCGANIPEERAVAAFVDDAKGMLADGRLDEAAAVLTQALERSPENLAVARAMQDLERRREDWRRRHDEVRDMLGAGRAADAHAALGALADEFHGLAELDVLAGDVRSALAAQDPAAAADAEAQAKARRHEEEGRIREALVAWRGVLVLSPDDEEAQEAERRLATRVERAEALFAEATDELAAGDPETAVARLLEANTILPGDALIEGRMEEARRAAEELSSELAALETSLSEERPSTHAIQQLMALQSRFPGSSSVADALRRAETAGKQATADAAKERIDRAVQQGRLAQQNARPRDALAAWRDVVNLDSSHREAADGLALAERQIGEFDALLVQSRALLQSGDPERALERATAALRLVPSDPAAEAQSARCRTGIETMRHEADRIRSALQDEPDDDVLSWARDLASRFSGSELATSVLAEAEERFQEAAAEEAGERLAEFLARGAKLEQESNLRAALAVYEDALEIDAENTEAVAGRDRSRKRLQAAAARTKEAGELLAAGRPEDAHATARESLELVADQPEAASILARARAASAEIDRAIRSVREELDADAADAQLQRVRDLAERHPGSSRAADLVTRAEKVVEEARQSARHERLRELRRTASTALEQGRLGDAETACDEIAELSPDDELVETIRGDVAARRAAADESQTEAKAALEAGEPARAAALFHAALDQDPHCDGAADGLEAAEAAIAAAAARVESAVETARAVDSGPRDELAAWDAVLALDAEHQEAFVAAARLRGAIEQADADLVRGRELLTEGDPEGAVERLAAAHDALPHAETAEELAAARAAVTTMDEGITSLENELETAEGDLDGTVVRAEALAERFGASERVQRVLETVRARAIERRRALAVSRVRALIREKRYGEAVQLATSFRDEGIETPELTAALAEAEKAAAAMSALRERLTSARETGRLEDVRDVCREILHSLPDDQEARQTLAEVEETLREVAARRDLAETARRRGDVHEALRLYRDVLTLQPGSERIQQVVTRLESEAQQRTDLVSAVTTALDDSRLDEARKSARRLLDRYPDDDDARDLEAIAFGLARALDGALRRAERALKRDNDAARDVARQAIELAERAAPDDPRVARLREKFGDDSLDDVSGA